MPEPKYYSFGSIGEDETVRFCIACGKKHPEADWRWTEVKIKGKKKYFCHHGINCYGCQKIHYNDTGATRMDSRGSVCGKWFGNTKKSPEEKMKNLSPQEVMSGVQYGMPEQKIFRPDVANEDHHTVHQRQMKDLKEAVS
jgi:hypothetical protein